MRSRIIYAVGLVVVACAGLARAQAPASAAAVAGDWSGTLDTGAIKLRLVLHVARTGSEGLTAKLESVDQGNAMLPVDSIVVDGRAVSFTVARAGIGFSGTIAADGQRIEGTFAQGGGRLPLVFARGGLALNRPQEPKGPLPYRSENVAYPGGASGVTLAGTLTLPQGSGPFPAALLITGSGAQDRDEALMGHRPFLVLADHLTRAGIAVLRVDDRGVGKSTGNFSLGTTLDFAADAEAGVRYLKSRPEIAAAKIGLVGHSEGGVIAPIVASRSKDVAFIVMLAGTGVEGSQVLLTQQTALLRVSGASDAVIAARRRMFEAIYAEIKSGEAAATVRARIDQILADGGMSPDERQAVHAQLGSPWFTAFVALNPSTYIRQVKVPALVLNGSLDLQVDAAQNLPAIRAAFAAGGNTAVEIAEMPGLNHLFQHAKTGLPAEYGTIEETMAPEVLDRVATWIVARTGAR